jgi:cytochrome c biogenesis protein CcmG/thiol:disulfide interchange protein DsbE
MNRYLLPLGIFLVLALFLGIGLTLNPREVPSPFVGKPAPNFTLARLDDPGRKLGNGDLKGQVWLLNVWASWCVSCRQEHPLLVDMARQNLVPIYGLNYKEVRGGGIDTRNLTADGELIMAKQLADKWLQEHGNPYTASVLDLDGRVGIDYGVYGVPETFVIDKQGIVRYKQIGPITPDALKEKILPLVKKLQAA